MRENGGGTFRRRNDQLQRIKMETQLHVIFMLDRALGAATKPVAFRGRVQLG
jgi:hypothetical protein